MNARICAGDTRHHMSMHAADMRQVMSFHSQYNNATNIYLGMICTVLIYQTT